MLRNGVAIPQLGFGVFKVSDKEAEQAVAWALEAGYRHIDTAAVYGNETGVGKAFRASRLRRKDVFVTTKLWNTDMRAKQQHDALDHSLSKLDMDYVDLYLIHWPVENFAESWKVLEDIYASGRARAIGVSNFQIHHLEKLMETAWETPMVNQIECHPLLAQQPLIDYCVQKGIVCEAWGPFGGEGARLLHESEIMALAEKYGRSPAQIIVRWHVQRGVIPLTKSVHKERIASNRDVYDFTLNSADMAAIAAMNRNSRFGADPDNFNF